jgi:hypothetical protein
MPRDIAVWEPERGGTNEHLDGPLGKNTLVSVDADRVPLPDTEQFDPPLKRERAQIEQITWLSVRKPIRIQDSRDSKACGGALTRWRERIARDILESLVETQSGDFDALFHSVTKPTGAPDWWVATVVGITAVLKTGAFGWFNR